MVKVDDDPGRIDNMDANTTKKTTIIVSIDTHGEVDRTELEHVRFITGAPWGPGDASSYRKASERTLRSWFVACRDEADTVTVTKSGQDHSLVGQAVSADRLERLIDLHVQYVRQYVWASNAAKGIPGSR